MFDAINALLSATNLDELRAAVQTHAAVLFPETADQFLEAEIAKQSDQQMAQALTFMRELLRLCRQHGITEAFRRLEAMANATPGQSPNSNQEREIFEAIQAVLTSESGLEGLRSSIEANQAVLLQPATDEFLARAVPQQENPQIRQALESIRILLQACRQLGIAEAFRRLAENQ